jgi:hypothetical protein
MTWRCQRIGLPGDEKRWGQYPSSTADGLDAALAEQVAPQKVSPEMVQLLSRQNELVSGPMDDAADREYELISARIRELAEHEGASQ